MKTITQQEAVLKYVQTHKNGITSKEAFEKIGCTRLAAVISALNKKGYNIQRYRETVKGRYGNVSITRYKAV